MSAAHKNDRVRELFEWVKERERDGVVAEDMIDEIGGRAMPRYGLELTTHLNAVTGVRQVTFARTNLIIRHDGSEWQLT